MTTDLAPLETAAPDALDTASLLSLAYATDAPTVAALVKNKPLADRAHALARYRQQVHALQLVDHSLEVTERLLEQEPDMAKVANMMDKVAKLMRPLPEASLPGGGVSFRIILPDGHGITLAAQPQQSGATQAAPSTTIEVTIPSAPQPQAVVPLAPLDIEGDFARVCDELQEPTDAYSAWVR